RVKPSSRLSNNPMASRAATSCSWRNELVSTDKRMPARCPISTNTERAKSNTKNKGIGWPNSATAAFRCERDLFHGAWVDREAPELISPSSEAVKKKIECGLL